MRTSRKCNGNKIQNEKIQKQHNTTATKQAQNLCINVNKGNEKFWVTEKVLIVWKILIVWWSLQKYKEVFKNSSPPPPLSLSLSLTLKFFSFCIPSNFPTFLIFLNPICPYPNFKSDPTWHPITQHFHCRISKYYPNKDVCKKLELKIFKIWQNGGHFCKNKHFEIFRKLDFSAIFQFFFDVFYDFS